MAKKNPDSPKTSDGRNLQVLKGLTYPSMPLLTMKTMQESLKTALENLSGESTKVTMLLSDHVTLVAALVEKYGNARLLDVVNAIRKEAIEKDEGDDDDSIDKKYWT